MCPSRDAKIWADFLSRTSEIIVKKFMGIAGKPGKSQGILSCPKGGKSAKVTDIPD